MKFKKIKEEELFIMVNKFVKIDDIDVTGKRVLIRVDMNVPMKNGKIANKERIERSIPTIAELVAKKAKVIIISHLGRPEGNGFEAEFSLKPIAEELSALIKQNVKMADDVIGEKVEKEVHSLQEGEILMLENVRFYKAETKNDLEFTKKLAALGEIYVSDAFSAAHRAHSSTEGLAHLLPYAAGRLMQEELEALEKALMNPVKPVLGIVGGAKISTKLNVFYNLVKKVQFMIIGGGMANTFLNALGVDIGKSLCEHDMKDECNKIIAEAKKYGCQISLPVDSRVAKSIDSGSSAIVVETNKLPEDLEIFDIGDQSIKNFIEVIQDVKTVIWNGPVGAFEFKPFETGTVTLAKEVAKLTKAGKMVSIAGGGDTVSALQMADVYNDFTYVSTAGGAFLEWMEGKELPGVSVLYKK
jgi:phosphoglycerate kinase